MAKKIKQYRPHGFGTIYRRGNKWWGEIHFDGQRTRMPLGVNVHEDGVKDATLRKRAEAVMAEKTEHYRISDRVAYLEAQLAKLRGEVVTAREKCRDGALTLGGLFAAFESSPRRRQMRDASLENYERTCRRLADIFGAETVAENLTAADADRFMTSLGLDGDSWNAWRGRLVVIWRICGMPTAIWDGIAIREKSSKAHEVLTDEEIDRVTAACGERYDGDLRRLMIVGACTGMRLRDCQNLDWSAVDLAGGMVRVKTQKTGADVSVPILRPLRAMLESLPHRTGLVLPGLRGVHCSVASTRVFKSAGIVGSNGKKSFHSFRSTAATRLVEAGVPMEIVRTIFGHSTEAMTRHYTHVREQAIRDAYEKAGIK